jgi:hypothetical protein
MKPGDLVTIRKMNLSHAVPITYVDVYDRFDDIAVPYKKKWEHGEFGVLLEGRDDKQEIVQVLHCGRVGWVDEEMLRVINEAQSG